MADKPLSAQERAKAKEVFDNVDGDGDGKIDHGDLKSALKGAGFRLTDDEVQAILDAADPDGTGSISEKEFMQIVGSRPIKRRIEAALRKLFELMDTDGSGMITLGDIQKLVKEAGFEDDLSDDQVKEMFDNLNADGDGKVSQEEFLALFMGE